MYSNSNDQADQARQQEEARQKRINTGLTNIDQTFAHFDDKFYNDRTKGYETFAMPQEQMQEDKARRSLAFSLANAGLTGSGSDVSRNATLDKTAAIQKQAVVDRGIGAATELRGQVADQRSSLVNQLEQTADPNIAATGAYAAASTLHAPTAMEPLGDLFGDFTRAYVTNQTAKTYAQGGGAGGSPWSNAYNYGNGGATSPSSRIIP